MTTPFRRPFLPRGLFSRAILILLGPVIVLQLVVGYVFFERHYQRVTHQMTRGIAMELRYIAGQVAGMSDPAAIARQLAAIEHPLSIDLAFLPGEAVVPGVEREALDLTGIQLVETLRGEFPGPLAIDLTLPRTVRVEMEIGAGVLRAGVLRADVPRSRMTVSNPHQLLVLMVAAALILTTIAVLFLRNQVRPIRQLAEAADAFGKGRSQPFRPAGAEEVRRAGAAFLAMRGRIERQIEQRTQMLSGVSHDLRTPLTRMKLTLAMMEEGEDVEALRRDVEEMEAMLADFLAFARGDSTEAVGEVDAVALAEAVAEDARRAGASVDLVVREEGVAERAGERASEREGARTDAVRAGGIGAGGARAGGVRAGGVRAGGARAALRAGAVSRALHNLVGNAARHGRRARLTVRLLPKTLDFVVEDDGPGIPAADRSRALQPFARLDAARNLDRGGSVGLGLTIALDIARAHGGTLELSDSADLGGLRATLRLPR